MRMLPLVITARYNNPIDQKIKVFKTRDSIAEFLDTAIRNTITDVNAQLKKNKGQMNSKRTKGKCPCSQMCLI